MIVVFFFLYLDLRNFIRLVCVNIFRLIVILFRSNICMKEDIVWSFNERIVLIFLLYNSCIVLKLFGYVVIMSDNECSVIEVGIIDEYFLIC